MGATGSSRAGQTWTEQLHVYAYQLHVICAPVLLNMQFDRSARSVQHAMSPWHPLLTCNEQL